MFKVGDAVTQSDDFYEYYKSYNIQPFHLKIIKIKDDFVQLDGDLSLPIKEYWLAPGIIKRVKTKSLHIKYIKLDTQYVRRLKLKKLKSL